MGLGPPATMKKLKRAPATRTPTKLYTTCLRSQRRSGSSNWFRIFSQDQSPPFATRMTIPEVTLFTPLVQAGGANEITESGHDDECYDSPRERGPGCRN